MKRFLGVGLFTLLIAANCLGAMTIHIVAAPQLTPLLDTIYVTGTFNAWSENDMNYMCLPTGNGWQVSISAQEATTIEFKFTGGSWSTVEGDAFGNYIPNRETTMINGSAIEVSIAGWEDLPNAHTVGSNVRLLDNNFYIPQLNRTRRIWLQLPDDYTTEGTAYPVWYFFDGQNLFDLATSFAGEWEVDESFHEFTSTNCRNALVVAVDNGGVDRIDEYSPWLNVNYNDGGEGVAMANFMVETLKPYIDEHYHTLVDASQTTISGSSLGALIATYILCSHPNSFGNAALFSPAYWFNPEIFDHAATHPLSLNSRVYFVCGTNESDEMVPDTLEMESVMQSAGLVSPETYSITHSDGEHSEWYWAREFPAAYLWLTQCENVQINKPREAAPYRIYPNPTGDSVTIEMPQAVDYQFEMLDMNGALLEKHTHAGTVTLPLAHCKPGTYSFIIRSTKGHLIHQKTVIKQ